VIPDLLNRYKQLVAIAADQMIVSVPPQDIYEELAREWFRRPVVTAEDRRFIMDKLKTELDRMDMFEAMHRKFGQHP
jgi:hypothetical protein